MKNLFYIPFLVVVALVYTRVSENPKQYISFHRVETKTRAPASMIEPEVEKDTCENIHPHFNPHYKIDHCF